MRPLLHVVPLALALIAAACGGDGDAPAADRDTYVAQLRESGLAIRAEIDALEGSFAAGLGGGARIADLLNREIPRALDAIAEAIDGLETVRPPAEFRTDHEALVRLFRAKIETLRDLVERGSRGDLSALLRAINEAEGIEGEVQAALTPEFFGIIADLFPVPEGA